MAATKNTEAMIVDDRDFEDEDWDADEFYCTRCDGGGVIVVCCDDLCHGMGYCMHGDGYAPCPDCGVESIG